MPHGFPGEHTVGRLGGALTKTIPPENLKENVEDLCRAEDQGILPCLGRQNILRVRKVNLSNKRKIAKGKSRT